MSVVMRHFIGGQQRLMPELLAMVAPTVNSFTRLVPGFWAPTEASWGIDNRTCALRVVPGKPESLRVEYRVAGADAKCRWWMFIKQFMLKAELLLLEHMQKNTLTNTKYTIAGRPKQVLHASIPASSKHLKQLSATLVGRLTSRPTSHSYKLVDIGPVSIFVDGTSVLNIDGNQHLYEAPSLVRISRRTVGHVEMIRRKPLCIFLVSLNLTLPRLGLSRVLQTTAK